MSAHPRAAVSLLAALGSAVVLALCGCSGTESPTVATAEHPGAAPVRSAGGSASGASPATGASPMVASPTASQSSYDKALLFTRCMTAHGVVTPDPVVGAVLVTGLTFGSPGGPDLATQQSALVKCKKLLPATWPVKEDPKDIARDRPFFDCLRKHGVNSPTPNADGVVDEPTDDGWMLTPAYKGAEAACRYLVDDPANNQNR